MHAGADRLVRVLAGGAKPVNEIAGPHSNGFRGEQGLLKVDGSDDLVAELDGVDIDIENFTGALVETVVGPQAVKSVVAFPEPLGMGEADGQQGKPAGVALDLEIADQIIFCKTRSASRSESGCDRAQKPLL